MSTPRFYSWDDDGSPGRALTGNLQNRLKQILVACLVNGYGSKPGAGWTLEHEHENGFTLSNGDAYVNFVSNLAAQSPKPAMHENAIHMYVAESLTDTSKAIIDGVNLCSGSYRRENSLNNRHALGRAGNLLVAHLDYMQWTLVADDKTFTINFSAGWSARNADTKDYSFTLYVGRVGLSNEVSGNFVVAGGATAAYDATPFMYGFLGFTATRDLYTGLPQSALHSIEPYGATYDLNPDLDIDTPPQFLNFQQPRLTSGQRFVGRLRGVVYDDIIRSLYGWKTALRSLGFTGTDFADRGKPVKIGDYQYAYARSHSGSCFLTDNPVFW